MPTQAALLFKISAENDADAALNELKGDLAGVDAEVKKLAKSSGLLPSEMRAVVKEFGALDKEADQVSFALKRFGAEGVEMVGTLQQLSRQAAATEQRFASLGAQTAKPAQNLRLIKGGADDARSGVGGLVNELAQLSPVTSNINQLVQGFTGLSAGARAVGVALGGVAFAAATTAVALKGIIDVSAKVGTKSKEDFDEFAKSLAAVGVEVTKTDRAIAQELQRSIDKLIASVDAMFLRLLREFGPALNDMLKGLIPVMEKVADFMSEFMGRIKQDIALVIAFKRTWEDASGAIGDELIKQGMSSGRAFQKLMEFHFKSVLKEWEVAAKSFPAPTFDVDKKKVKDKTDELYRELRDRQAEFAKAFLDNQINILDQERQAVIDSVKAGLLTREEASERLYDIERRRIDALEEEQLIRLRLADVARDTLAEETALEKFVTEKSKISQEATASTAAAQKDVTAELIKQAEAQFKQIEYLSSQVKLQTQLTALIKEATAARIIEEGRPEAGISEVIPGVEIDRTLLEPPDPAAWDTWSTQVIKGLTEVGESAQDFGDLTSSILGQFASAAQASFAAFILTGRGAGAAFKKIAADAIAAVAIQSTVNAIFEWAQFYANMAIGNYSAALLHGKAATMYTIAAGVAGATGAAIGLAGGLGGGGEASAAGEQGTFGGPAAPESITQNFGGAPGSLGQRPEDLMGRLADAINRLGSMPAGDVLTMGVGQNPQAVAVGFNEASRRSSSELSEGMRNLGLR